MNKDAGSREFAFYRHTDNRLPSSENLPILPNAQMTIKSTYHLQGRPDERLILINICERLGVKFKYDAERQCCVITAQNQKESRLVRATFDTALRFAIRKLVFVRADPRFETLPVRTIDSKFMRGFADGYNESPIDSMSAHPVTLKGYNAGLQLRRGTDG